jgi:hypothetical protein
MPPAASRMPASYRPGLVATALTALFLVACDPAKVDGGGTPGTAGAGGVTLGGGAGGSSSPPGGGVALPDAAPASEDAPPPSSGTCAEDSVKAERVPVDLLLLVDSSSSMATAGAGTTVSKYNLVKQAMIAFSLDPASAGLGLGLQFFPQPGSGSRCASDADCGGATNSSMPPCQPVSACAQALAGGTFRGCSPNRACPAGDSCVPLGRCARSLADCTAIGQPCPGGVADDTCMGLGKACESSTGERRLCTPDGYVEVAAPIAPLPAPGQRLIARGLGDRSPGGDTPLRPAVEGSLMHLRAHLAGKPGRKGALVLASDGVPSPGCPGNTIAATSALLAAARMATPPVPTYVIGVYLPAEAQARADIDSLASAGGGAPAFVIAPNEDLGKKFLDTLAQIRGQALPCELTIPAERPGALAIDFGKVNVRWKGAAGEEDVLYTGGPTRCDRVLGGWHYDVDPATGARPTRIVACEATCRRWKAEPTASVDLRFGCQTRVIE